MNKTLAIAWREFTSTVLTKGFIIGVGLFPAIMSFAIIFVPKLITEKPPKVDGVVAVIDQSGDPGRVAPLLEERITPERMKDVTRRIARQAVQNAQKGAAQLMPNEETRELAEKSNPIVEGAAASMVGEAPKIRVETLPSSTDPETEKSKLREIAKGEVAESPESRLALIVIKPDSVSKADPAAPWGAYDLFVRPKLDERWQGILSNITQRAVIDARLKASGQDADTINALMNVPNADAVVVTAQGEREGGRGAQFLLPMAFMMLLWISTFTGGQYLLTTTIEEKSNRIMEVLLSAVSPMQLMVGKIFGQMGVGLLILGIYAGLGLAGLTSFNLLDLIDWTNVIYLMIYFFIAFFLIASLMAAVGSAVSDVHEAQSLVGPVMMVLIIPMLLIMPVSTNPHSMMATVLSFIPPISPFMMVLRIAASQEPLPFWQIALSIAIGLVSVCIAAWAAAKIFRIGVLLYGKPPNFATLLKWIRMA